MARKYYTVLANGLNIDPIHKQPLWFKTKLRDISKDTNLNVLDVLKKAHDKFSDEVNALKQGYVNDEVQSWAKQEIEAKAYILDNTSDTPLIKAIATARQIPIEILATKIIDKSNMVTARLGTLIGIRQHCEDLISVASSIIEINNVNWPVEV